MPPAAASLLGRLGGGAVAARGCAHRHLQQLSDIDRFHAVVLVGLHRGDAVLEHLDTEGTGHGHDARAGVRSLLRAHLVHAAALLLLKPDHATTRAAAKALGAVA